MGQIQWKSNQVKYLDPLTLMIFPFHLALLKYVSEILTAVAGISHLNLITFAPYVITFGVNEITFNLSGFTARHEVT